MTGKVASGQRMNPLALVRFGSPVASVFNLRGQDENALTMALGFTLARSPRLLHALLEALGVDGAPASLRLETADDQGRTDLEIDCGRDLVVVEAKRGQMLTSQAQLAAYAPRVVDRGSGMLVTLSDASEAWARVGLPETVADVPVRHLPWATVWSLLRESRRAARGRERFWLDEFSIYLEGALRMTDPCDGRTYCVVLSRDKLAPGAPHTFMDVVLDERRYYHAFGWGPGWPAEPPNFLAFRWDAAVRHVCRVVGHEVVPNLQSVWPDFPETETTTRPYRVHHLGPSIPIQPLPNGSLWPSGRFWVSLDQLFTAATLKDAIEAVDARPA